MDVAAVRLQKRLDPISGFLGCEDGIDFKISEVIPIRNPLIGQAAVTRFHELKTAFDLVVNPA